MRQTHVVKNGSENTAHVFKNFIKNSTFSGKSKILFEKGGINYLVSGIPFLEKYVVLGCPILINNIVGWLDITWKLKPYSPDGILEVKIKPWFTFMFI